MSIAMDEEMVLCPYNKAHHIARRRLIPHLVKCRLSYPDVELVKCPFNASHLIPEPEFSHHASTCKDKAIIHQYKYNTLPVQLAIEDRQKFIVECDENWDDTEVIDYDPSKYLATKNVIRKHIGNLKSVRKEFRKSERKRLGDLDSDDDDVADNLSIKKDSDNNVAKNVRKRVYEDIDCKKKEDPLGFCYEWFEDLAPSSSSKISVFSKQLDYDIDSYSEEYACATPLNVYFFKKKQDEDIPKETPECRKEAVKIEESCNDSYRIEYSVANPLNNYPKERLDPIDEYLKRRLDKDLQKKLENYSDEEPYDPIDDYSIIKQDEDSPKKLDYNLKEEPCDPLDDNLKEMLDKDLQKKLDSNSDEEPYDPIDDYPLGSQDVNSPMKHEYNSDEEPYDPIDDYALASQDVDLPNKQEYKSDEEPYDPVDDYPIGSQDEDSSNKQENNSKEKVTYDLIFGYLTRRLDNDNPEKKDYNSDEFKKRMQDKVSTLRSTAFKKKRKKPRYPKNDCPKKEGQDEDSLRISEVNPTNPTSKSLSEVENSESSDPDGVGDSFSKSYEYTRSLTGMFSGLKRFYP